MTDIIENVGVGTSDVEKLSIDPKLLLAKPKELLFLKKTDTELSE